MNCAVAYAKAFPTETSEGYLWDVSCLDCEQSIGTMHSKVLQEAIINNLDKGGVKCPECRRQSCDVCGINVLLSRGEKIVYHSIEDWPLPAKLCAVCKLEIEAKGEKVYPYVRADLIWGSEG